MNQEKFSEATIIKNIVRKVPKWISFGRKVGSQCSNSSAHEYRKTAGQTTNIGPSSWKQHAIAIACNKTLENSGNLISNVTI